MRYYISAEEEELRMSLYNQGLVDRAIGRICNRHPKTIASWRYRKGLPQNGYNRRVVIGKSMVKSLTPTQCESMREFLRFVEFVKRHKIKTTPNAIIKVFREGIDELGIGGD